MSSDGRWIACDDREGNSYDTDATLFEFDEEQCVVEKMADDVKKKGQMIAGPGGRFLTMGKQLFHQDFKATGREFAGSPVAIHPTIDLAASFAVESKTLILQRFSDGESIDKIELPLLEPEKDLATYQEAFEPCVQFDLKNASVFFGTKHHAYWIDLRKYANVLKRQYVLQVPLVHRAVVDDELRIPILVNSKKIGEGQQVKVSGEPEGSSIQDGVFVWRPNAQNVGDTTVRFELENKEKKTLDVVDILIHVHFPQIDFGFEAESMVSSTDGSFLVISGKGRNQDSGREPGALVVVDVKEWRVIGRREFQSPVVCTAVDEKHVYYGLSRSEQLMRSGHAFLEPQESLHLGSLPRKLFKLGPNMLVAPESNEVIRTEPFERISNGGNQRFDRKFSMQTVPRHDSVSVGGKVIDLHTGNVIRITGSFPETPGYNPKGATQYHKAGGWGRELEFRKMVDRKNNVVCSWEIDEEHHAISSDWPIMVSLSKQGTMGKYDLVMGARSVLNGDSVYRTVIYRRKPNAAWIDPKMLVLSGRDVLILREDMLIKSTIPDSKLSELQSPGFFKEQQRFELPVGQIEQVPINVGGNIEGVTFSVLCDSPTVSIDAKDGILSIDTKTCWDSYLEKAANSIVKRSGTVEGPNADHGVNAEMFKWLTGHELPEDKFAIRVPVQSSLAGSMGFLDTMDSVFMLIGPQSDVNKIAEMTQRMKDKDAAEQAMITKNMAEREFQMEENKRIKAAEQKAKRRRGAAYIAQILSTILVFFLTIYGIVAAMTISMLAKKFNWDTAKST